MGDIYLELIIANIKDPERPQEVSFLVDTGATRAWVSKEIAEAVGIELAGTVPPSINSGHRLELADGSITERPYGFCLFAYDAEIAALLRHRWRGMSALVRPSVNRLSAPMSCRTFGCLYRNSGDC